MKAKFKINNKIRLIELFAGVGSQAMALRNISADYEHYMICEWWVQPCASYKAIHCESDNTNYSQGLNKNELIDVLFDFGISNDGKNPMTFNQIKKKSEQWLRDTYNNIKATKNLVNIQKIHGDDLKIVDTDLFTYIMTYSFPCQDLSVAGKMAGMDRGSGTRSGMLWEVERLLKETDNLPQMLNAKDYGVAQNRQRAYMVSILGDFEYTFPKPIPLNKSMADYLEDRVAESYYINSEKADTLISELIESGKLDKEVSNTVRGGAEAHWTGTNGIY